MPHVNDLHEQHDPILVVSLASGDLASCRPRPRHRPGPRRHAAPTAPVSTTTSLPSRPPPRRCRPRSAPMTSGSAPEQAARLQPGGWRRFFTAPGALFSRQLGVGLTTLGIAGILISSIGTLPLGGMAGSAGAARTPGRPHRRRRRRARRPRRPCAPKTRSRHPARGDGVKHRHVSVAAEPTRRSPARRPPRRRHSAPTAPARRPRRSSCQMRLRARLPRRPTTGKAATAADLAEAPAASDAGDAASLLLSSTDDGSSGPPILLVVSSLLVVAGVVVLLARRVASGARSA